MYFICFQEMVDLNATNVMVDSGAAKRGQVWEELITATLNERGDHQYRLLISKHLVGILLCVYARKEIAPHVQDLVGNTAATGILGVMGNKGGAAVSTFDMCVLSLSVIIDDKVCPLISAVMCTPICMCIYIIGTIPIL